MTKKKEQPKIVTLDNKSRKGVYIYIRKDGHTHYYKYHEDMKPKGILKHYLKELNKIKEKGTQQGRKLITPKKEPIEQQITRGILQLNLENMQITPNNLQKLKEKMFKNNIKNKKLLTNLVKDNNLEKIKHRFEITITIHGEHETLATISRTGITPDQAIKQINKNLTIGEHLDSSPGMKAMNELGWNGKLNSPGTITKITGIITFRKDR